MESMGKKSRRRRSFAPEFKAEIVKLCQRGDRSVGQVAKGFDLTETAARSAPIARMARAGRPVLIEGAGTCLCLITHRLVSIAHKCIIDSGLGGPHDHLSEGPEDAVGPQRYEVCHLPNSVESIG
jgi:hypothetical protein